jgi:hypothetical protein
MFCLLVEEFLGVARFVSANFANDGFKISAR